MILVHNIWLNLRREVTLARLCGNKILERVVILHLISFFNYVLLMKHLALNPFNLTVLTLTLSRISDSRKVARFEYKTLGYKLQNTNTIQRQRQGQIQIQIQIQYKYKCNTNTSSRNLTVRFITRIRFDLTNYLIFT